MKRNTIKGKVTHAVGLILVVTITVLTVLNVLQMQMYLLTEEEQLIQSETNKAAEEINTWLTQEKMLVESASYALSTYDTLSTLDAKTVVKQFYMMHSELENMYVGFADGRNAQGDTSLDVGENYDPRTRSWYLAATEKGSTIVTNPYQDIFSGQMCCTIATPVYKRGELVCVVAADVALDTVVELVDSISYEEDAYGFLIDTEGNIISHKNEDFEPTAETVVNIDATIDGITTLFNNPAEKVVQAKDYDGTKRFFASSLVGNYGWLLYTAVPISIIFDRIGTIIISTVVVAIIMIILAAWFITTKITKLLKPMEEIAPAMERISAGDFSTWVNFTDQNDEIGDMQNSMSVMVNILSDIIKQEKYILGEIANGNLMVEDMDKMPGELEEISRSVNNIKFTLTEIIRDIQFSAINLQSTAMGLTGTEDPAQMQAVFDELSAEAQDMLNKASMFRTTDDSFVFQ